MGIRKFLRRKMKHPWDLLARVCLSLRLQARLLYSPFLRARIISAGYAGILSVLLLNP